MKARTILLALLALALASIACQPPAQEPAGLSEEDVAAIQSIMDRFTQAVLAGDLEGHVNVYAADGVRMPPNEPANEGHEAIRAALEAWRAVTFTEISVPLVEIDGRDGIAYGRGTGSWRYEVEGMPQAITDVAKYLLILRKQSDGSWLITHWIYNSDLPLPGEGAEPQT